MEKEKRSIQFNIFLALALLALFFGFFIFAVTPVLAEDSQDDEELEEDIDETQKKIEEEEAKRQKLLNELNQIQGSVNRTSYEINKTQSFIDETKSTISRKESEIKLLNEKIELQKVILTGLLREIYYSQNSLSLAIMPEENQLSQFLGESDHLSEVERQIVNLIGDIKSSKEKVEGEKAEIKEEQEKNENLLTIKEEKQKSLLFEKYNTQSDIQKREATISELYQKLAELKSDLYRILGKSYDTGEIKDAIKFANKVTGVRKGFLFGMLSMESGGNPLAGSCTLKNCGMNKNREKYFEKICDDLDYSEKKCEKMPLSCASKSYPGSGGAMGAAQFMSDTWWGYKDRIAAATGHNPPDPWNLIDGVTAMALYLKDLGAANDGKVSIKNPCSGNSVKVDWEIYASMRYLGWTCWGYTNYAPAVQSLANGYDKL